jgi:hypothetical protein
MTAQLRPAESQSWQDGTEKQPKAPIQKWFLWGA